MWRGVRHRRVRRGDGVGPAYVGGGAILTKGRLEMYGCSTFGVGCGVEPERGRLKHLRSPRSRRRGD